MIDLFLHFQNKRRNRSEKLLKLAQSATIFCGGSGKFAAGVGGRSCHCDRSQGGLHQSVAYPTLDAPTFGFVQADTDTCGNFNGTDHDYIPVITMK